MLEGAAEMAEAAGVDTLGRDVHDYDLATTATWDQVEQVFENAGFTVHETGVKHGTVTVVLQGNAIEVTTYRTDWGYSDGRHPDNVAFVQTIGEDLARRDFTMNALAWHPVRGLIDPYGGAGDIEAGVIRAVGEPKERFSEDALRILRGCRFESQLGFSIDPATYQAMCEKKHLLMRIAKERIVHELDAFVLGAHVRQALLDCVDIISPVIPELAALKGFPQNTPYHCYDVLEHTACTMENIDAERLLRWAALLHDIGKPATHFTREDGISHFFGHARIGAELAEGVCKRLGFPRRFSEQLVRLVAMHDDPMAPAPKSIRKVLLRLDGDEGLFRALCALKRADSLAHAPEHRQRGSSALEALRIFEELKASNAAWSTKGLAISGDDLLELGYEQGPAIGFALRDALEEVIDEKLENDRDALLKWARERLNA